MTEKRDLFSQFRDQSKDLKLLPRPQLWERLESRLDMHRRRTRTIGLRNLIMAATLAMLAVSSVLLLLKLNQIQEKLQAARSFQLTELPYPESAPVEPSGRLVHISPAEVPEGLPHKRLFARTTDPLNSRGISWFGWMVGAWENAHQKGVQETWTARDTDRLQGSLDWGHAAQLSIRKRADGQIVFQMPLTEKGAPVVYELSYLDQQQAIFENTSVPFPRQVIVQRLGPDHLGFVYRNPKLEGLQPDQAAFLAQHHRLQAQQISRQLFRIREERM